MSDWVRNDLSGKGARLENPVAGDIPAVLIIAPLWLIPTSVVILAMTALLFLPFLYFAHALDSIWRCTGCGSMASILRSSTSSRVSGMPRCTRNIANRYGPRPD